MKKVLVLSLCVVLALLVFASSAFAATYNYGSFTDGNGYGTKTEVDENVTNLKGGEIGADGMAEGPYSKAAEDVLLTDGISEETNVEINLEKMAQGEFFEVSLALKDTAGNYLTEAVVMAQKVDAETVRLTAGWAPSFSVDVKESGVYTFKWEMYTQDDKSYVNFSLLDYGTAVGTTGPVELTDVVNPEGVTVKYLWFCNIQVAEGVNVYAQLPAVEEPPVVDDEENGVNADGVDEPTTEENKEEKDDTPKTGTESFLGIAVATVVLGTVAFVALKRKNA